MVEDPSQFEAEDQEQDEHGDHDDELDKSRAALTPSISIISGSHRSLQLKYHRHLWYGSKGLADAGKDILRHSTVILLSCLG